MRGKSSVLPAILLVAALAALVLPSAFMDGGVTVSAALQPNADPSPQVIRIGKPTPSPTPKKSTIIIGSAPAGAKKTTPQATPAPTPAPTPAQKKQGVIIKPGTGGGVRQVPGGLVVGPSGSRPDGVLKSPKPPSLTHDLRDDPDEKMPVWLAADKFFAPNAFTPVKSQPFTAAELIAVDEAHNVDKRITKRPNKTYWVKYWKGPDGTKKQEAYVEIEKYVAQLNEYEKILNDAGCTLRKGPLALGAVTAGGNIKPNNSKLGEANPPLGRTPFKPLLPPCRVPFKLKNFGLDPAAAKPVLYHDPNLIYQMPSLEDYLKLVRNGRFTNPVDTRVGGRATMNPAFGVRTRRSFLARGLHGGKRVIETRSGVDCGDGSDDGNLATPQLCPDGKCPDDKPDGGETGGFGKPCGGKKPGNTLKCLYDGRLAAEWPTALTKCINAGGGNGWFGASLCAEASFLGSMLAPNSNMSLSNGAGAHLDITMLGVDLEVLSISAESGYEAGQPIKKGPELSLLGVADLPATDFDEKIRFLGPQAFIMIGPVPISLKTGFDANFGAGPRLRASAPVPFDCSPNNTGKFGIGFDINADASLWAEAALDIFVASAGVRAELVLTDDRFGLFMETEVRPSANEITVTAGYDFEAEHMKGVLSAFVEVDLLVYSDRFDIELFSFGGYKTVYPEKGEQPSISTTFGGYAPPKPE